MLKSLPQLTETDSSIRCSYQSTQRRRIIAFARKVLGTINGKIFKRITQIFERISNKDKPDALYFIIGTKISHGLAAYGEQMNS